MCFHTKHPNFSKRMVINMKGTIKKLIWIAIGQFICAVGYSRILVVNDLVATGFGGLASVINKLTGLNVQFLMICMAVPVFVWSFFCYNKKQILFAIFSFSMFTFYIGIVEKIIPAFKTDTFIASLAGGIVMGIAAGIIMKQRVANGPEAVVGLYLKEKKGLSIGNYFLVINTVVILSSLLSGNLTLVVYSFFSVFVQSVVTDTVIIGTQKYYVVNIMSDKYLDIAEYIQNELHHGVTFVKGMDVSNMSKKMLMQTVLNKTELIDVKEFVKQFEDDSFIYASQSSSLLGRGYDLEI